ncbi:MAG: hypothetical protein LBD93_05385 [Treponema sp.]|jgi:hypothetical protein|nr:hypothetical protein [Treponema sp.]
MKGQAWMFLVGFLGLVLHNGFSQAVFPGVAPRDSPYLIPQTVFVGDPGRLVVPLGPVSRDFQPFVLEKAALQASQEESDLVMQRIELENRTGQVRLIIDFVAYSPGLLSLPDLPLLDLQSRGLSIAGVRVGIASLLTKEGVTLSEALPPLVIPGTTLLLYGSSAGIVVLLLGGIGCRLWGRDIFKDVQERFRRRRLIRAMKRLLRNLGKELKDTPPGEILCRLSGDFRHYLSLFTGMPCEAMDAGELQVLPPLLPPESARPEVPGSLLSGIFLCGIFRRCDALRFSGTPINQEALLMILRELQGFTQTLDRTDKERNRLALLPRLKPQGSA